jgi:DNA replication protein DnaC
MDELMTGASRFRKQWRNAPLVVLDDLATRTLTDAQLDALLQIINIRDCKPLVVTCNLSLSEVQAVLKDARIPSRLSAGYVIEVTGDDRRLDSRERITA